ncbi:ABC transporter ATP-binding protein [Nocardioides sp. AX2bis]|uniref:ABC transporter ATP-binding protein n=1 Tax=Nocardioides sp. AX2bis TaxID=2653157 RepID=UPI0012F1F97C|nr:ABC transporter ATP-binding protein [Nocardioides sp. AX2bis]VXB59960.1 putative Lipid A export ATP-binding/permease protein MsbA [Nocardioides sp. AX2bis]
MTSNLPAHAPAARLREIVHEFWPYAAPRRGAMVLVAALSVAGPVFTVVEIYLFKVVVDDILIPRDFALFPVVAATYLGLTLAQALVGGADRMLSTWLTQRFLVDLRQALLRHLGNLPLDFFSRSRVGDLLARVSGDVAAIEGFLVSGSTRTLTYLAELVLFTGALVYLDPTLALLSLAAAPLFWLSSRYFSQRMREVSRERQRRSGSISTSIEQTIGMMPLVQAYDRVDDEVDRYAVQAEAKYDAEMASARLRSLYAPTVDLVELVGALTVIGAGAWLLTQDRMTVGELLAFLTYLSRLFGPIRGLGSTLTSAYSAAAGAERVLELLGEVPLPADRPGALTLDRSHGDVVFHTVSYTYPGAVRPAVTDISFRVSAGELVAVVGASGAGKSTLARLLTRSADPTAGEVRLDGHDLRDLTRASLRRQTAVVLQETLLRDGTVRENIAFGLSGATDADVERAARSADAHDFVVRLPLGYDTPVGDRGRRLSGGQAQRIAIARALLRDAPVLLLDEPTSGLDAGSTDRVVAPLLRLAEGRATLMISHNLATTRHASRILVLDEGRLVEEGTHQDLLRAGGTYADLWLLAHPDDLRADTRRPDVVPA